MTLNTTCFGESLSKTMEKEQLHEIYIATSEQTGKLRAALEALPYGVSSSVDLKLPRFTLEAMLEQHNLVLRPVEIQNLNLTGIATGDRSVTTRRFGRQLQQEKDDEDLVALRDLLPPFALSIVEEGICTKASRFIGSRQSTWTLFVAARREATNPDVATGDSYLDDLPCTKYFSTRVN